LLTRFRHSTNHGELKGQVKMARGSDPSIGEEVLADWLADRFGIDQRALLKTSVNSLI
jgi:hypothetical protein